jgi:hypothetical protein
MLVWHKDLWLIDHGAALYFHHGWSRGADQPDRFADQPYDATHHIMLSHVDALASVDAQFAPLITHDLLTDALGAVPDEWLEPAPGLPGPGDVRGAYVRYLLARAAGPRSWLPRRVAS